MASDLVDEEQATEPHFFFDFQLDSDFTEKNNESQYPYYKLNGKFNGELTGKVFIENTQIDSKITLIAMQGRDTILISEKGKEKWGKSYILNSKKNETIDLDLDIKWDQNGSEEIIIFPLVDSFSNFYLGAHASVVRLYVGDNKEYTFSDNDLQTMAYDKNEDLRLIPELVWVDGNNNRISTAEKNGYFFAKGAYNSLLITSLIKDSTFDLVYLNELGESKILFNDYYQVKNKETVITFKDEMMQLFFDNDIRQYILVINNENDLMLRDIMAVNENINSITTSFQAVIQIIPPKIE